LGSQKANPAPLKGETKEEQMAEWMRLYATGQRAPKQLAIDAKWDARLAQIAVDAEKQTKQ